ncbi:MAG TPA: SEC-C metal-binding domain-containing protein [Phycisphaerae bacterium]|nr:SEC-C metal-binding domain-containing protein [Phycisphaerae bacterium]HRW52426.1 SEC-C metal-binding domain-containing protein [Phycisphaerae bacterium]
MGVLTTFGTGLRKVFGSRNDRIVKKYRTIAEGVGQYEAQLRGDYDAKFQSRAGGVSAELEPEERDAELQKIRIELCADLREHADALRARLADGESDQAVMEEAFAVIREASRRARNHRHFDCQLIGAQVLYNSTIAEMKTGEGKTIVCHPAAFLKVLQGLHVHIVTVNDYLVRRDAEFAASIFELLGITVGYIQSQVDPGGREGIRRAAYACNITYGTNNEFGFDYLRDNMKISIEEQVQGPLDFTVVDEVDSILIDEARTPLIISGPAEDDVTKYRTADAVARVLIARQKAAQEETLKCLNAWGDNPPKGAVDHPKFKDAVGKFRTDPNWITEEESEAIGHKMFYVVAKERKSVSLTHDGISVAQEQLGVGSLYVGQNMEWPHVIENSVRAHVVYENDVDYVVKDGEIIIVDSFTGRLMHGRQWSDGLHQAVEAKEGVRVKEETQTLATITLQNFFKLYQQLSGMTGTAMTEADEFTKIYNLDVVAIPTNRPVNRVDHHDKIYKTIKDKFDAIVEEINDIHAFGRTSDPFVLEPLLTNLRAILAKNGESTSVIDDALAQWKTGKVESDVLCDAYDRSMGDLARGRPVLVGTVSIDNSEKISEALTRRYGVEHEVLNAKQHAREADIVTKAGQTYIPTRGKEKRPVGNVTIATNMAGRGTDIKLAPGVVYEKCIGDLGPPEGAAPGKFAWHEKGVVGTKCCISCPDYDPKTNCAHCWKPKVDPRFPDMGRKVCALNVPCGLHIVGTERHESRRIDNQLRGRSGRQGDPGSSRFFLSLGDDLLKLFMGDWMLKMLERMGFEEGMAIEAKAINKGIERAQKKVEERNFGIRKNLLEYDEVMDHQRKVFYAERQKILAAARPGKSGILVELIWRMIDSVIDETATRFLAKDFAAKSLSEWVRAELEVPFEPKYVDIHDQIDTEKSIRAHAKDEARNLIAMQVGEYMDADVDPADWDIRGLAQWASQRFGSKLSQNQLRTMSVEEVQEHLLEASEEKIDAADLAPIERFFDPEFGKRVMLGWAHQKFGIALVEEEFREIDNTDLVNRLRQKIRDAYREREIRYPVEWILDRTLKEGHFESAYAADALVQWANQKFNLGWTVDNVQNRPVNELATELFTLNRDYTTNGRLKSEVEKAMSIKAGADTTKLAEWGRERFGPTFDDETFNEADKPEDALLMFGRDLLRAELTRLERYVLIQIYDQAWKEHMYAVDLLKESIGLRGYAEQDPKIAYKKEASEMFNEMLNGIEDKVTGIIFRARLSGDEQMRARMNAQRARHDEATNAGFSGASRDRDAAMKAQNQESKPEQIVREQPKVGRNAPCPCGSGKKYKQCCGKS